VVVNTDGKNPYIDMYLNESDAFANMKCSPTPTNGFGMNWPVLITHIKSNFVFSEDELRESNHALQTFLQKVKNHPTDTHVNHHMEDLELNHILRRYLDRLLLKKLITWASAKLNTVTSRLEKNMRESHWWDLYNQAVNPAGRNTTEHSKASLKLLCHELVIALITEKDIKGDHSLIAWRREFMATQKLVRQKIAKDIIGATGENDVLSREKKNHLNFVFKVYKRLTNVHHMDKLHQQHFDPKTDCMTEALKHKRHIITDNYNSTKGKYPNSPYHHGQN
jgi:hypothetical protein